MINKQTTNRNEKFQVLADLIFAGGLNKFTLSIKSVHFLGVQCAGIIFIAERRTYEWI